MPDNDPDAYTASLLRRLIGGNPDAAPEVRAAATTSTSPSLLVAAALITGETSFLLRAAALATSTRDRQLVALAESHLTGDTERLDVLVRDHLAEHPDSLLASWIAGESPRQQF